jgi:predicted  nucleic acid-binding Zn-ribbon protein
MRIYENIRRRKSGVAVTRVNDGSCTLCGANIRPMELQSTRIALELVFCSSCGRILYVG